MWQFIYGTAWRGQNLMSFDYRMNVLAPKCMRHPSSDAAIAIVKEYQKYVNSGKMAAACENYVHTHVTKKGNSVKVTVYSVDVHRNYRWNWRFFRADVTCADLVSHLSICYVLSVMIVYDNNVKESSFRIGDTKHFHRNTRLISR